MKSPLLCQFLIWGKFPNLVLNLTCDMHLMFLCSLQCFLLECCIPMADFNTSAFRINSHWNYIWTIFWNAGHARYFPALLPLLKLWCSLHLLFPLRILIMLFIRYLQDAGKGSPISWFPPNNSKQKHPRRYLSLHITSWQQINCFSIVFSLNFMLDQFFNLEIILFGVILFHCVTPLDLL